MLLSLYIQFSYIYTHQLITIRYHIQFSYKYKIDSDHVVGSMCGSIALQNKFLLLRYDDIYVLMDRTDPIKSMKRIYNLENMNEYLWYSQKERAVIYGEIGNVIV